MSAHNLKDRWTWPLLLLALTVAYYVVPWGKLPAWSMIAGLPFLFFYTVVLPGIALTRYFTRDDLDAFEKFTFWSFHGLFVLLFCCFAWALSGVSLTTFKYCLPVVIAALTAGSMVLNKPAGTMDHPAPGREGKVMQASFGILLLTMAVLLLVSGAAIDYSTDSLDHVGYINEVAASEDPFPTTAIYRDPGANGEDLRKGLVHSIYGFYKSYLGADTVDLLRGINTLWSLLLILAVYTTANRLFRNRAVAVLSSVLFIVGFEEGLRGFFIRTTFYPNRFALGFLLLFLSAGLEYLEHQKPRLLALCAVYAFGASAVHIQYVVFLAFSVLSIGVWKTCFATRSFRAHARYSLHIGLAAFAGLLPYAVYRYLTAYQASDLHHQIQGVVFITDVLFVVEPSQIYFSTGLIGFASVLAIFPLWRKRKSCPGLGYLIASSLTILVTVCNPLVLPIMYKVITYLAFRLLWICPFYMLAAYLFVDCFTAGTETAFGRWLRRIALAALVAALVADVFPVFRQNTFTRAATARERGAGHSQWEDGLEYLRTALPERSVIASDPMTSYTIDAFTPHYVVSTFDQHAPPNDLLVRSRTMASRDILNPYTSATEKADLIAEYGVTHVVVNGRLRGGVTIDYWMINSASAPLIRERLLALSGLFEVVYDRDEFLILRCTGIRPTRAGDVRVPALLRQLPDDARAVGEAAGVAVIEAARVDESRVFEAGDTLDVTLYWSRRNQLPIGKYVVTIRFDRNDNGIRFGEKLFPKVARKLEEFAEGERYRFRSDHKILNGFFDPDLWPDGQYVMDKTKVIIPGDVAAGRYTVRAILLAQFTVPNVKIRDILYDDDIYHGVEIGEISIDRR